MVNSVAVEVHKALANVPSWKRGSYHRFYAKYIAGRRSRLLLGVLGAMVYRTMH